MTDDRDMSRRTAVSPRPRSRIRLALAVIAVATALSVLVGLGAWQWQRLAWKQQLIRTIADRAAKAPIGAAALARLRCDPTGDVVASCDYVAVRLTGRFDHRAERHVFISVPPGPEGPGGPGYWVFTPFQLETGGAFWVNRGFVPEARKQPQARTGEPPDGLITITGQLRAAERRGLFSAANDAARNIFFVRDPEEFGLEPLGAAAAKSEAGTPGPRHFYIDMLAPVPPTGEPRPLAGRIAIPNRHFEYALSWWALAATLVVVIGSYAVGRRRFAGGSRAPPPAPN